MQTDTRTSLPAQEQPEIHTPFVARLLTFTQNTPYIVCRGHCKDHDGGVGALTRFPGREIIPQSGKFARFPQKRHRPDPRNRSTARSLPFGLRSARAEDAYPSEKTAVLEASSGQNSLGAAAPRMGHAAHGKAKRIAVLASTWWRQLGL